MAGGDKKKRGPGGRGRFNLAPSGAGLFAAALLLMLNLALGWLDWPSAKWLDRDAFVWRTKLSRLDRGELRGARMLILGDSQAMSGILPEALGAPGLVYNLGLPALQPEGLAGMIESPGFPRAETVVLNVSPFSLFQSEVAVSFRSYARRELWTRRPEMLARYPYLTGTPAGVAEHLAAFAPLYRLRDALAGFRIDDRPGWAGEPWNPPSDWRRRWRDNERIASLLRRGAGYWSWNYVGIDPVACPPQAPASREFSHRLAYHDRPAAAKAWRDVLKSLSARRVFLVQLPLSATWHKATNSAEVYRRLDARVAGWQREFPNLILVPRPAPGLYGGGDFIDWTHLSYCGAAKYTAYLKGAMGELF